jgi:hypothetical protein
MPRRFSFPRVGVNLLNQFQQILILLSRREAGQASRNNLIVTPLVRGRPPAASILSSASSRTSG